MIFKKILVKRLGYVFNDILQIEAWPKLKDNLNEGYTFVKGSPEISMDAWSATKPAKMIPTSRKVAPSSAHSTKLHFFDVFLTKNNKIAQQNMLIYHLTK